MLAIIDGTNIVRRFYHAGGTFSLSRFVDRVVKQVATDRLVIAWDAKQPYWRHELYADYKAHRHDDPQAAAFVRNVAREAKGARITGHYADGMEADDVAATLVATATEECVVVTSDKDWCQLIADGARWIAPINGGALEERDEAWVWRFYSVGPGAWPDYVALAGDTSDNIPGVRGIGPRRAAEILREHDAVAWALATKGPDTAAAVELWKRLATLRTDANLRAL